MKPVRILIDTDIGDDVDDAFALLLAMDMRCDIVGVTTVFGNTQERARIAKKLLSLYGQGYEHVPVFAGYGDTQNAHLCQYTPDLENPLYRPDGDHPETAVDFIIDSCRRYGEELTVVAIGPFTNIARVIEKDPAALSCAHRVVIMGGAYFRQYPDWNVWCDPAAAACMFQSLEGLCCLGADVTHKLALSSEEDEAIDAYSGHAAQCYTAELYRMWKKASGRTVGVLHDPLAVYCAADPSVCLYESAPVAVVTEGYARGLTLHVTDYGKAGTNPAYARFDFTRRHHLAKEVDRDRIVRRFMQCFR